MLDSWLQDLRYAARLLRRNPLFALTAALSLAIGISAKGGKGLDGRDRRDGRFPIQPVLPFQPVPPYLACPAVDGAGLLTTVTLTAEGYCFE